MIKRPCLIFLLQEKMVKIYPHVAGNTLGSHKKFIKKLKKRGAKIVTKPEKSDVIVVFCPIVSRYETDVKSALSSIPGKHAENQKQEKMLCNVLTFSCKLWPVFSLCAIESSHKKVVLVAMHHTFDPNYTLPSQREIDTRAVTLIVDCLFFEKDGLLRCSCNKNAIKRIRKEVITQALLSFNITLTGHFIRHTCTI